MPLLGCCPDRNNQGEAAGNVSRARLGQAWSTKGMKTGLAQNASLFTQIGKKLQQHLSTKNTKGTKGKTARQGNLWVIFEVFRAAPGMHQVNHFYCLDAAPATLASPPGEAPASSPTGSIVSH